MNPILIRTQKEDILVFLFSFIYLSAISVIQYFTLGFEWHDAGSILYALSSPQSVGYLLSYEYDVNYIAEHSSYIFGLISPVFSLLPYLEFWILFQILSVALGVSILGKFFRMVLEDSFMSMILAFAFLLNPYVQHSHLYPHFEILWIPFLTGFLLSCIGDRPRSALLFLGLSLLIKEDYWIYALGACWILIGKVSHRRLFFYSLLILLYAAVVPFFLTPYFFPNAIPHLRMKWGKSPSELLTDGILHPLFYLKLLFSGQGKYLFLSVLGLPWLSGWRSFPGWAVAILWMSSISLDRAFLSFYYGLPSIILLYHSLPFAFWNLKSWIAKFRFHPNWIYAFGFGLLLISVLLSVVPGPYTSRGPTLPKLREAASDWKIRSKIVRSLVEYRSYCDEKVFASFSFAPYVFCGNDLRLPYKHWNDVVSGVWTPDLAILSRSGEEVLTAENSREAMVLYFEKNKMYAKDQNATDFLVWRRIKNTKN